MKKILFILAIVTLFISCKKDKPAQPTPLDATGAWNLYSSVSTFFTIGTVTADTYPCMKSNVLIFKSDSTYSAAFTGTGPCYVTPTQGVGAVTIGSPAQQPTAGTWRRNGNDIYIKTDHYVITNVNNQLILTATFNFTVSGTSYTTTEVFHKF